MQADIPKQGPTYFPMDKVGATGDDPVFLLNRQNASSTSNLINNSSTSLGSPYSATGDPNADKKKYTRLARILAILLILMSIIMFIAGVINIIFTSTEIARLAGNAAPTALRSSIFIWVWATPGVWASIPPFVAGIALLLSRRTPKKLSSNNYNPGLPIELQNSQENYSNAPDAYRIFAVFSITFSLPVGLLLAILDVVVSVTLSPIPYAKVILPIIVALMAIIDFVLLLVAWYGVKDASDNEYQYIGSTYTIYETYEPLLGKEPPVINTLAAATPILATQQCCPKDNSSPIVIINQPPVAQPIAPPINVLIEEREPPRRPRPMPRPMPVPVPVPVPVVPRPQPMLPLFNQQRYYPNQMYGPPPSGILGRPNAYRGMFLPSSGPGISSYGQYGQFRQFERP